MRFQVTKPTPSFNVASFDPVTKNAMMLSQYASVRIFGLMRVTIFFRTGIFDFGDRRGEFLPLLCQGLVEADQPEAYPYNGVYVTLDTFKEKQALDDM